MRKTLFIFISAFFIFKVHASETQSKYWSYDLKDLYSKKVDNQGEGYEPLSELRNFRVVLYGVLYRSGANNVYNKKQKRENENPLPNKGLHDLCQQNFSQAFYLYKKNYEASEKSVTCKTADSTNNTMQYQQLSALDLENEKKFLHTIHQAIENPGKPILVHCWNGWHASGLVSTLALRQFCHFSGEEGLDYWIKNTDGNNKGYEKIKKRIKSFQPYRDLKISKEVQQKICPQIGSASQN